MTTMSRRRFLHAGAGAAALAAAGCAGRVLTAANEAYLRLPTSQQTGQAALGWYRGEDRREICERLIPMVTDMSWLSRGDSVFVKVACNSSNPHPAVTCPETTTAVVKCLLDRGAGKVYAGDQASVEHVRLTASGRQSSTRETMARNGLLEAIEGSGAQLHNFDDHGWDSYFRAEADFADNWDGELWLPKILGEVDHVVNLPRLGSHALAGYSCGLKNAVGWLRDDSRLHLHRRADSFFEQVAEINHFPALREKLRLTLTIGDKALLNIGPDFGSIHEPGAVVGLGSTRLVDHDLLASTLLSWFEANDVSFFDIYSPYPKDAEFWNRGLVEEIWGEEELQGYRPLLAFEPDRGIAFDRCLSRIATLQGYRPGRIEIRRDGGHIPEGLVSHLKGFDGGIFAI